MPGPPAWRWPLLRWDLCAAAFDGRICRHTGLTDHLPGSIGGGRLVVGMQCLEETYERRGLGGRKRAAIGRHVPAAEQDLAAKLILGEPRGHAVEGGAAHAAEPADRVAVAALLLLEDVRALPLQRSAFLQVHNGHGRAAPRAHLRAPRRRGSKIGKNAKTDGDEQEREHCDGTPPPALLADARDKRQ